ncbi:Quinolinate phosphoribosyltransferase [decarboxylating] [hydrothermal vent metagenome]|uniref:Probable nicotinate-nucleotide pyrophosphorylase [carboxylating] n=1 Tax=hydrothermal vent metagenome TaxID=652676 RepID=A0A3B0X5D9_9ZZZZ
MNFLQVPQSIIEENVFNALKEDIGEGDITSELIPRDNISLATVISRESCIFCGLDWFEETFRQLDTEILIDWCVDDGDEVKADQIICTISGSSQNIVSGERTALNFIQTLSATATLSRCYANEVANTETKVLDTRKTIPGLRMAQKYAVSCGGCNNHRIGLFDAFLIKENHINACDGIENAVEEARFHNPDLKIEVEVENMDELQQAIDAGADRVLLDNFNITNLRQAVDTCKGKVVTEASGNITINNIKDVAKTGVDFISTGALTKDIKAIDLSMRFD